MFRERVRTESIRSIDDDTTRVVYSLRGKVFNLRGDRTQRTEVRVEKKSHGPTDTQQLYVY